MERRRMSEASSSPKPQPRKRGRPPGRSVQFHMRILPEERAAFERAAETRGLGVSTWARMVCLEAARRDER